MDVVGCRHDTLLSASAASAVRPWLLVVDAQRIFADPPPSAAPTFPAAMERIAQLAAHAAPSARCSRAGCPPRTAPPPGATTPGLAPSPTSRSIDALYELVDAAQGLSARPTVDEPTFGKWGPQLEGIVGPAPHLLVAGVSTDCCVVTTVLAAADAGAHVTVVTDACAPSTPENGEAALRTMGLFPPQVAAHERGDPRRRAHNASGDDDGA